jgi:hypothetical protein
MAQRFRCPQPLAGNPCEALADTPETAMALLIFRSRAASEILMQSENAQRLLAIMGKPPAERGVITSAQIDDALACLAAAVAAESPAAAGDDDAAQPPPVGLRQRAFPLMEMLRAARRSQVDVTWGI